MFRVDVLIAVDCSEKDLAQWAKKHAPLHLKTMTDAVKGWDEAVASGITEGSMVQHGGGFVVFLKPNKNWIRMFGCLVHELTHVTQYLLNDRRIPLTKETTEVHAYLVEHLVMEAASKML